MVGCYSRFVAHLGRGSEDGPARVLTSCDGVVVACFGAGGNDGLARVLTCKNGGGSDEEVTGVAGYSMSRDGLR